MCSVQNFIVRACCITIAVCQGIGYFLYKYGVLVRSLPRGYAYMWTGVVIAQYPEWRDGALDGGKIVIVLLCGVLGVQEECVVSEGEPAM